MVKCIRVNGSIISVMEKVKNFFYKNIEINLGEFTWPDGKKFVGSFKDDKREGLGEIQLPNGKKCVNDWKNDKLI